MMLSSFVVVGAAIAVTTLVTAFVMWAARWETTRDEHARRGTAGGVARR